MVNRITAYPIMKCCIDKDHHPMSFLLLSEADIKDKSKADWLANTPNIMETTVYRYKNNTKLTD